MSADTDFKRRVRAELVAALDRIDGPHASWADSPAAAVVADDPVRRARPAPWRLLAVAAVLVAASLAAVILSSPRPDEADPGIPGCPTLADYAAASAMPSPDWDSAPDISFPPVAPTATMTTGLLQPGDWAVIADEDGPGLQIRVRDVRECGRLPDLRSQFANGSLIMATVDVRALRTMRDFAWLGMNDLIGVGIGEVSPGFSVPAFEVFGVPGVVSRSNLGITETFAQSSLLVLDVPDVEHRITADHPGRNVQTLPGIDVNAASLPQARWVLREGPLTGYPPASYVPVTPGPTDTTGIVAIDEQVTVHTADGPIVFKVIDVDTVTAYPGRLPTPGHVFLEARVQTMLFGGYAPRLPDWRAMDGNGNAMAILQDPDPQGHEVGVLEPLLMVGNPHGWLVVEAPPTGPVTLEYRHDGTGEPIVIRIRD